MNQAKVENITTLSKALGHITAAAESIDEACVAVHMLGSKGHALRLEGILTVAQQLQAELEASLKDALS